MPPAPRPSTEVANQPDTRFGFGFELDVGDHTFILEPRALWSADELKQGTFEVALPKDDTRDIGSFADFWEAIDDEVVELPDVNWSDLGDPLDNLATAHVTLREFRLKVVKKELEQLVLDVTFALNWKVPGLKKVTVKTISAVVEYKPKGEPAAGGKSTPELTAAEGKKPPEPGF